MPIITHTEVTTNEQWCMRWALNGLLHNDTKKYNILIISNEGDHYSVSDNYLELVKYIKIANKKQTGDLNFVDIYVQYCENNTQPQYLSVFNISNESEYPTTKGEAVPLPPNSCLNMMF